MKYTLLSILLLFTISIKAVEDEETKKAEEPFFNNIEQLDSFFAKLQKLELERSGQINIVHIGDSHIQADFFTNAIREPLQNKFGNAGLGFIFPYNLIQTNGSDKYRFSSSAVWTGHSVAHGASHSSVGLGGMGMHTSASDFIIELSVKEENYKFNKIKLITKEDGLIYNLSTSKELSSIIKSLPTTSAKKYHRIKGGESLSVIARRYGLSVGQLQRANRLRGSKIQAGKTLVIPSKTLARSFSQEDYKDQIVLLDQTKENYQSIYTGKDLEDIIALMPNKKTSINPPITLSGLVLENGQAGVIYHNIGVNSARYLDYNKYPLFFNQLPVLTPDLIVISLGTNESYSAFSSQIFMEEMRNFITRIKGGNPNTAVLVMTPPPSMLRRRKRNRDLESYVKAINEQQVYASWDLFSRMGATASIEAGGEYVRYIKKDRVHYLEEGYRLQGVLFYEALMAQYDIYKQDKGNIKSETD